MSPPDETKPQVIAHDPVAHTKLDALKDEVGNQGKTLGTILSVLTSGLDGKKGVLEVQRDHAEALTDHEQRLDRQDKRLDALEAQDGTKAKSTLQLLTEKALQLITMLLGSSIGGAIAQRISHH